MHVAAHPTDAVAQLFAQLRTAPYDVVVVDAGSGISRSVRETWRVADQIVLVTGDEAIAAMDAYAAVKVTGHGSQHPISTLVNGTRSPEVAAEIHERISQACRRFLGRELLAGGMVPRDPKLARRAAGLRLGWPEDSQSDAMRCFQNLARHVANVARNMQTTGPGNQFDQPTTAAAVA